MLTTTPALPETIPALPDMAGLSRGKTIPIAHVAGYMRSGLNLYGGTVALDSNSIPVRNSGYNERSTTPTA